MMFAHVEINSGYPWVDEFFGHPHEYWPIYIVVATMVSAVIYLLSKEHQR